MLFQVLLPHSCIISLLPRLDSQDRPQGAGPGRVVLGGLREPGVQEDAGLSWRSRTGRSFLLRSPAGQSQTVHAAHTDTNTWNTQRLYNVICLYYIVLHKYHPVCSVVCLVTRRDQLIRKITGLIKSGHSLGLYCSYWSNCHDIITWHIEVQNSLFC